MPAADLKRSRTCRHLVLPLLGLLLACPCLTAQDLVLPDAPGFAQAESSVTLTGTVTAQADSPVQGATVTITSATAPARSVLTDDYGVFTFTDLPAGPYTLAITLTGFDSIQRTGSLLKGQSLTLPAIALTLSSVSADVSVTATRQEIAAAEVRVEETQRLAGFLPNFYVTYDWHAAPLTWRQKYDLAWKNFYDPANFLVNAAGAGIQQATNAFPGYGSGPASYGKRLGASVADFTAATYLGGAVIPSLLHQDPRYFFKGFGTIRSRALYAVAAAFICRGDNGKWQPNVSSVLGDLAAGALSNAYYPASDRNGAGLTFENGGLSIAGDAVGNLLQEFFFNRITPTAPTTTTPHDQGWRKLVIRRLFLASQPASFVTVDLDEPPLSREEGFALLRTMRGFLHQAYQRSGGVEAVIREMDGEDEEGA